MNRTEKQLNVRADLGELDPILEQIEELLSSAQASGKAIRACQLSVEELFVNVASYAYTPEEENPLCSLAFTVEWDETGGTVSIEIRDHGREFDPFAKEDPDITLSADERQIGGLGIYMSKKLMDTQEYRYEAPENVVLLTKSWQI